MIKKILLALLTLVVIFVLGLAYLIYISLRWEEDEIINSLNKNESVVSEFGKIKDIKFTLRNKDINPEHVEIFVFSEDKQGTIKGLRTKHEKGFFTLEGILVGEGEEIKIGIAYSSIAEYKIEHDERKGWQIKNN